MILEVDKAFPPDRESAIAEFYVSHDGGVDIPADVYRENGELMLSIFGRKDGVALDYPLRDLLEAIERAVEVLGDGSPTPHPRSPKFPNRWGGQHGPSTPSRQISAPTLSAGTAT